MLDQVHLQGHAVRLGCRMRYTPEMGCVHSVDCLRSAVNLRLAHEVWAARAAVRNARRVSGSGAPPTRKPSEIAKQTRLTWVA